MLPEAMLITGLLLPLASQEPPAPTPLEALAGFEARLQVVPEDADALVGAGFAALRLGRLDDAAARFTRALRLAPAYVDALYGLALCEERRDRLPQAKALLAEAARRDAARQDVQDAFARIRRRLPDPPPPVQRPAKLQLGARVDPSGFELPDGKGGWTRLFLKGMNLGAALPGKFPSEFPEKAVYAAWLRDMAELGVNSLRVYTIHPPGFYEALREHNLGTPKPIYLLHGVWAEPPEDDDFRDPAWLEAWKGEMRHVIDLLHGRANLPERPGHAAGVYRADVSPWWIATILGREWEPYNVVGFNAKRPGHSDFEGRFVRLKNGHATEVFMAEAMELFLAYEHDVYHAQRPMAFTNWPTLDPLHHPTETTKEEEDAWRQRLGLRLDPGQAIHEFDNDAIGLDMEKADVTPLFQAGLFASYHAYPYYPDFINLDPGYAQGRDAEGPNNYVAYLRELVRHHARHAVVISEFGVPSSRLVAHWQPQGLTHGGQNEREQGNQNARMFRNIHDSGCAGGMLFAWIDEWFKKNWLVIDFESPLERKPLWYNPQDAEENYGLLGLHPGSNGPTVLIDGRPGDWAQVPVYLEGRGMGLKLRADEGWLHLGLFWAGTPDWDKEGFLVGLDTLGLAEGNHRPPFGLPLRSEAGLEFALELSPKGCAVWVDEPYDLFTHRYARPYRTLDHAHDTWVRPRTESNRFRIGRDGTRFPFHRQEIGTLRRGTQDRRDPAFDSGAEWMDGPGFLEVRIPWGLLQVTDPSSRQVVQDSMPPGDAIGTATTPGFRACLVKFHREGPGPAKVSAALPEPKGSTLPSPPLFTWAPWETPTWHAFRKQSFERVKAAIKALPDRPKPRSTP